MNYMEIALEEAKKAMNLGEVPVGAVIVKDNKIISKAHNLKETLKDPTAHAEILAIRKATELLDNWRLIDCEMYVTLEPCPMCAGAILQSRLSKLHIGTFDEKIGACGSIINLVQNDNLNFFLDLNWKYNDECSKLLSSFFDKRRNYKCKKSSDLK